MKRRMGENITLEWNRERFYDELQFSLNNIELDRDNSLTSLERLVDNGSNLAMVYLGSIYLYGKYSVNIDIKIGMKFLCSAFSNGSIEGGYILAHSFLNQGQIDKSIDVLEVLSEMHYCPAQFKLGKLYYNGHLVRKDKIKGMKYIDLSAQNGHFFAKSAKYHIKYSENSSYFRRCIGYFLKFSLIITYLPLFLVYSNSDIFRK